MLLHVNYKIIVFVASIFGSLLKIHEMWCSFDMIENPVATGIKILGIIAIVIWFWTDSYLQSEG